VVKILISTALTLLWLAVPAAASIHTTNLGCGSGKLVLNVRYGVANDVDTGTQGNNWAFDNYSRTVHVWRKAAGRFCAASTFDGQFTTIAGPSPGGKTTIPAGIHGTLKGQSTTTFRGTLRSGLPTRGDLGAKNFQCTSADKKGQCAGTYDWLSAYFTSSDNFKAFRYVRYAFTYHATEGGKGTWTDKLVAGKYLSTGDIRPLKKK
jgi:energy-coupling factor transporter ATP-binding protein EcfA2